MNTPSDTEILANIFRGAMVGLVKQDGPDLSARQMAVFLTCYLEQQAQTVRGLSAALNISKPAVTRALDRLADFELVRRRADPSDGRSVLVQKTPAGAAFVRDVQTIVTAAAADARQKSGDAAS